MCAKTVLRHKKHSRFAYAHQAHFSRNTHEYVCFILLFGMQIHGLPYLYLVRLVFWRWSFASICTLHGIYRVWFSFIFFLCLIFYAFTILFIDVFFFHCSWCLIRRIRTHSVSATIHKDTSGKAKRYIIIFRHGNGKMTARSTLRCCQLKIKIIFSLPFFPSHLTFRSRFFSTAHVHFIQSFPISSGIIYMLHA